jgi:hypothetical protein
MGSDEHERDVYHFDDDRELSTAVLDVIAELKNEDMNKAEYQLYDDIEPDALNNLFREESSGGTSVEFDTDDVTVTLHGSGTVQIRVTQDSEE